MKMMRRLTAVLAAGAMVLGMSAALPEEIARDVFRVEAADYTEGTYEMLTYRNYGDHVEIVGCNALAMTVEVPSELEGVPVTVLDGFTKATMLSRITLPNSITTIGNSAFLGCVALASITIPDSVRTIETAAFKGCTGLTEVIIPYGVTTIGTDVFEECTNLKKVSLPESLTSLGTTDSWILSADVFNNCTSLTDINIPNSITILESCLFKNCTSLKTITIPDSVKTIEDNVFHGSGLQSIAIPDSVTTIGHNAFLDCTELEAVKLSNNLTSIDEKVFSGCTSLKNISIPNSVTKIYYYSFSGSGLTRITIPESVSILEDKPFNNCENLASITILNPYCSIDDIPQNATIYGYEGSSAHAFAIKYGRSFVPIRNYVSYGNYNTTDTYSFPNTSADVPLEYYEKYLDTAPSLTLWEWLRGVNLENGCCSGFTTTAISSNMYSTPLISAYTDSPANLFAVQPEDMNSGNNLTAMQNIMYGQVYQYTPYVQSQRDINANDYQALYDAVIDYCAGGEGVYVSVSGPDGGHALWALGIVEDTTTQTTIAVYDCNHPGTERDLILYKTNGQYSGWEYALTDTVTWSSANEGSISFMHTAYGFSHDLTGSSGGRGTAALIAAPDSVQVNTGGTLLPIQEANALFDEDGNLVETVSETAFYWADAGKSLNVSNVTADSEIAIAFEDNRITAALPANATMSANTGDTSYANITAGDAVSVAYETISAGGEVSAITVDAEGDLNTRLSGNVLTVYGTDVTVSDSGQTYTMDDNTTYAITLSEDHTEILSVEEVAVVLGDLNADTNIDASDAAMILVAAAAVGAGSDSGLTADQEAAADVTADGTFNAIDAAYILQYAAAAGAGYSGSFTDFLAENM